MKATEQQILPDGWHSDQPHVKCCKIPHRVKPKEVELYRKLIAHICDHPDKDSGSHECCGTITITEKSIIVRCPKCGDAKVVFE